MSDRSTIGQRVTVTGATGLVGPSLVAVLRERGAQVTVLTRDPERARARLGAVDAVHEIVALGRHYGARVHVDAAYGGFFRLIADDTPEGVAAAPFAAIAACDSVVIDPHKHGLQPYGCGAVIFRDPSATRSARLVERETMTSPRRP